MEVGPMKIGFVGLGNIGLPMATNLSRAGYRLNVHDLNRERADTLLEQGATWSPSPAALAAASDVVITSLPGPAEVASVMEAEHGVLSGIRAGATWIEMSTSDLKDLRRVAEVLKTKGVRTIDAPVSGGVPRAWQGFVTIYVGGEQEDVEHVRPVLNAIGDKVFHLGKLGSGQVTKVVSNMLSFVHHVALGEALAAGARAEIDLWQMRDALLAGYGGSFACSEGAPLILDGSYNPNFTLDLVLKDFALARELSKELACGWKLIPEVEAYYEQARQQYGGDAGMLSVVRLTEDAACLTLRASKPTTSDDQDQNGR
jgi:3-hydroxyisobutyrate dehydrogenase